VTEENPPLALPKLNLLRLSLHVADLWLVSEGSHEWVGEPKIRRLWHVLFFSVWISLFVQYFAYRVLQGSLADSPLASTSWCLYEVLPCVWLLYLDAWLACRYYRYLLLTGKDLRFSNVAVFWSTLILMFAGLYERLYVLKPSLFTMPNAPFVPNATVTIIPLLASAKLYFRFFVYSASTALTLSSFGLGSASLAVSTCNLIEVLGSVLLIALLVSTFVNKSSSARL
jgi:hypothetical protein